MSRRILTVVLTDIEGFSRRARELSRPSLIELLEKHEEMLLPIVESCGGRVLKTLGDSFLLVFDSATEAVMAGALMQARLRGYNEDVSDEQRIRLRVAVDTGEVDVVGAERPSDVFGDPVHVASLIAEATKPGEVYLTEATYLSMRRDELPIESVELFELRGLNKPVQVYRVLQDPDSESYRILIERLFERVRERSDPDAPTGSGVMSRALLHERDEREHWLATRGIQRLGPWLIAAVSIPVVFVLAWTGVRELSYQTDFRRGKSHLEQGDTIAAVNVAATLYARRPSSPRAVRLLQDSVTADVRKLIEEKRLGDALRRLEHYQADFPYLVGLDELERDVRLELVLQGPPTDLDPFIALLQQYPEDLHVRKEYARAAVLREDVDVNLQVAAYQAIYVAKREPEVAKEPWFAELAIQYLRGNDIDEEEQIQILDDFLDLVGHELERVARRAIFSLEERDARVRWNSRLVLRKRGVDFDEFRFYLIVFLVHQPVFASMGPTGQYMEKLMEEETPEEIAARVDFDLPTPHVLSTGHYETELILAVVRAVAEPLRDDLEKGLEHENQAHRARCLHILEERGWMTDTLYTRYHLSQLRYSADPSRMLTSLETLRELGLDHIENTEEAASVLDEVAHWCETAHQNDQVIEIFDKTKSLQKALRTRS